MKKNLIGLILLVLWAIGFAQQTHPVVSSKKLMKVSQVQDSVYLMSFFKGNVQHLHYAYSYDARHWVDINNGNPVFNAYDDKIWLRDPFMKKVTQSGVTKYHLVHTWGWDNPAIFHWESTDLIHWTAANGGKSTSDGKIPVMDGKNGNGTSKNAWAPEFTFDPGTGTYYIYWASNNGARYMQHFYCTTKDWITFSPSALYFDPGITTIDMTIVKSNELYYAFYKGEGVEKGKIKVATSKSLDPAIQRFTGTTDALPDFYTTPAEGPSVFRTIGGKTWYIYWDKFVGDLGLSYATSINPSVFSWSVIPDDQIVNPTKARHGSVEIISKKELSTILDYYK